ncbi:MAG: uroporphyrinogen-III synthase [Rhodobacteraceae bacterium]|nr:uroporphyrinogen-III synthase [Paracoccaceae bacterium]
MEATPILILIRPEGQSKRLLKECEAAFGSSIAAVISPVMKIVPVGGRVDLSQYSGVIVTSVNAVHSVGNLYQKSVYCVGKRTEIAARKAGGKVVWTEQDSDVLLARLMAEKPDGPLVYLRGEHVARNIATRLENAGIETISRVVYDQVPEAIGFTLQTAIGGDMHAVLPLYSPRSAYLLGQGVEGLGASLQVIAISDAVAQVWRDQTGGVCDVCAKPDGAEMIRKIVKALRG